MKYEKLYALILGVLTLVIIIFAVAVPMQGLRKQQLDSQTADALQEVEYAVTKYVSKNNGDIPTSIDKITFESYDTAAKNKATLKRISIKEKDSDYQLCGTFYTDTKKDEKKQDTSDTSTLSMLTSTIGGDGYGSQYNVHDKGEYCFDQSASMYDYNYDSDYYNYQGGTISTQSVSSDNSSAKDTERKTDIMALASQLEVYYANFGNYPLLSQLNDANWVKANLKGLSTESLKDPAGSSQKLADKPGVNIYSYEVIDIDGNNCTVELDCAEFTLVATLDTAVNGSKQYVKMNLSN